MLFIAANEGRSNVVERDSSAMTYDSAKIEAGRRPTFWVQLLFDQCIHSHSVGICSAPSNPGGECYNTFATCQSKDDYNGGTSSSIMLASAQNDIVGMHPLFSGDGWIPCIEKIRIAPTKITPGRGLGHRASITLTCLDFPIDDTEGMDPYRDTRPYIARENGTFWGKLLARNVHYTGRSITLYQSHEGEQYVYQGTRQRTYIIDRIEGPDKSGKVQIIAKDPLSLAQSLKAQLPEPNTGKLTADLEHGIRSHFSVGTGQGAQYPSGQHWVRIGSEIIKISSRSGDTFTISDRGDKGTTADDHKEGDVVQSCYVADGTSSYRVDNVIYSLLIHCGIPSSYINTTDWSDEADTWAAGYYLETVISKPTAVSKLLDEICVETNSNLWWDDRAQKIRWEIQLLALEDVPIINDHSLVNKSCTIKSAESQRVSQVYYYCNVDNWAESRDEKNYKNLQVRVNLDSESDDAFGTPAIKKIFCRWVQATTIAGEVGSRIIQRFKNGAVIVKGELDAKDDSISAGDHFALESNLIQSFDGSPKTVEMEMLSTKVMPEKSRVQFEAMQFTAANGERYAKVSPPSQANYTASTGADQIKYSWLANGTTFKMSNGDDPYIVL